MSTHVVQLPIPVPPPAAPEKKGGPAKTEAIVRFMEKVIEIPNAGRNGTDSNCWLWTGARHTNGYGQFWSGERKSPHLAHDWIWQFENGELAGDLELGHLCLDEDGHEHRLCCNPDHVRPMTHTENMQMSRRSKLNQAAIAGAEAFFASLNNRLAAKKPPVSLKDLPVHTAVQ